MRASQKGFALVLAMIFMTVMAVITAGYIFLTQHTTRLTGIRQNEAKAFYLAEAGLHKAVWYLTHTAPDGSVDGSWRTSGYPQDPGPAVYDAREENLGEGAFIIWVENDSGRVRISARGNVQDAQRTIRQEFSSFAPVAVMASSWKEIGS